MRSFISVLILNISLILLLLPIPFFYIRSDVVYPAKRDHQVETIRYLGAAAFEWKQIVLGLERTNFVNIERLETAENLVIQRLNEVRNILQDSPDLVIKFETIFNVKQRIIRDLVEINQKIEKERQTLLENYHALLSVCTNESLMALIDELFFLSTEGSLQSMPQTNANISFTALNIFQDMDSHSAQIIPFLETTQKIFTLKQTAAPLYDELQKDSLRRFAVENINIIHREIREALKSKEKTSTYLLFYAIILVIFLAILIYNLKKAYLKIKNKNTELYNLNNTLEEIVSKRTQELQTALSELSTSQALLIQTEKLASVGQFIAGIAHEVNTPLAYVKSAIEMLRSFLCNGVMPNFIYSAEVVAQNPSHENILLLKQSFNSLSSSPTTIVQKIDTITADSLHGIQQIVELIDSFRRFLRKESNQYTTYNLNTLINDTLRLLQHILNARCISVVLDLNQTYYIECIPSQINQVLINVLSNAIDASQNNQQIELKLFMDESAMICIEIKDQGCGFTDDQLDKIFDPFYTTKPIGKGTGLGLFISYHIIQNHNGKIQISSAINQGTVVKIFLPIKQMKYS